MYGKNVGRRFQTALEMMEMPSEKQMFEGCIWILYRQQTGKAAFSNARHFRAGRNPVGNLGNHGINKVSEGLGWIQPARE